MVQYFLLANKFYILLGIQKQTFKFVLFLQQEKFEKIILKLQ